MSIPKEPRQLMINLMYLVLTAMLALNVSAEIINAFFKIGSSIEKSNTILASNSVSTTEGMSKAIEKRPNDRPYLDAAKQVQTVVSEFNDYIEGVKSNLDIAAGGLVPMTDEDVSKRGKPVRYKDKDVPQRIFVDGDQGKKPVGPELKAKVLETKAKLVAILDDILKKNPSGSVSKAEIDRMKQDLTLEIDDESWKAVGKPSWEQFTFGYMPVAACYPILRKFQNDARNAEASMVNYFSSQIGATVIEFNKFAPVASAEKSYVIEGEPFKAEVFLSAFSSQAASGTSMRVNGASIPVKDGIGTYSTTANSIGEKSYKVDISLKNPFTGKVDNFSKEFKYEVGRRSVTVSADKMNVFYIGVENPVSVAAAGVSSNQLKVSASGVNLSGSGSKYVATASRPGEATISVSGGGLNQSFKFRVKPIPDPVAKIANKPGGTVGNGEFRAQRGIIPVLENFDFEAKCQIQGFQVIRVAPRQDAERAVNAGGSFDGQAAALVSKAKPGDQYFFQDVKARCPGDAVGREINSLSFTIK